MRCWFEIFLTFLALSIPVRAATTSLVVGEGGMPWAQARDFSQYVFVSADSLWIWEAGAGQNLSQGILERAGRVFALVETPGEAGAKTMAVAYTPLLEKMFDGDPSTAFNPDEAGLPRNLEIYIDLGGSFGTSRVRLFPRQDSGHRQLFLQAFNLGLADESDASHNQAFANASNFWKLPSLTPLQLGFLNELSGYFYPQLFGFSSFKPNEKSTVEWPGIQHIAVTHQGRYLRLRSPLTLPWEIAELQLYSDGTVPEGEFLSLSLAAKGDPVWGKVQYDGGDLSQLPVILQTRTGPDPEPLLYFIIVGEREKQTNRRAWELIPNSEGAATQGPVRPNPAWSPWQTVEEGVVRSPSPNRYLQFRLRFLAPGVRLQQLKFEYTTRPLSRDLEAEISPLVADPGQETSFVLSMVLGTEGADTGFRYLQLLTSAEIAGVDSVRVDGQERVYTIEQSPGQGITLNLWERLLKNGSFIQIFFRARVFVDGTTFFVRCLDHRFEQAGTDTTYQFAREGDVDPLSLGEGLVVRLRSATNPLVAGLQARTSVFTPNGDGVNDFFAVEYSLLKLTLPAPVFFELFDLSGLRVRQGYAGANLSGQYTQIWDGRDDQGRIVEPGLYVYRIQVQTDSGTANRQGVVSVVY